MSDRAYYLKNRDKILTRNKEYARLHPEVHRKASKTFWHKHPDARKKGLQRRREILYGLTPLALQAMIDGQGGVCAICGGDWGKANPCVDHDHATGKVRGILCHRCNSGIGMLGDSPDIVESAAKYLRTNPNEVEDLDVREVEDREIGYLG